MIVVADTGAVYALLDRDDAWHRRVSDWWGSAGARIILPQMILPEIAWLVGTRLGAEAEVAFVQAVADGEFELDEMRSEDLAPTATLVRRYRDLPLGFVDAAVLVGAARLGAGAILTTDRRHFGVVRLPGLEPPTLVP